LITYNEGSGGILKKAFNSFLEKRHIYSHCLNPGKWPGCMYYQSYFGEKKCSSLFLLFKMNHPWQYEGFSK